MPRSLNHPIFPGDSPSPIPPLVFPIDFRTPRLVQPPLPPPLASRYHDIYIYEYTNTIARTFARRERKRSRFRRSFNVSTFFGWRKVESGRGERDAIRLFVYFSNLEREGERERVSRTSRRLGQLCSPRRDSDYSDPCPYGSLFPPVSSLALSSDRPSLFPPQAIPRPSFSFALSLCRAESVSVATATARRLAAILLSLGSIASTADRSRPPSGESGENRGENRDPGEMVAGRGGPSRGEKLCAGGPGRSVKSGTIISRITADPLVPFTIPFRLPSL